MTNKRARMRQFGSDQQMRGSTGACASKWLASMRSWRGARRKPLHCPTPASITGVRIEIKERSTPPTEGRSRRELNMSDAVTRVTVEIAGKEISFETGKLAKQATGAVVVRAGDTMVLCTAVSGISAMPTSCPSRLTSRSACTPRARSPAHSSSARVARVRRARSTARMIDRPIRPLFPKGWRYETQLVAMPLSVDHVNPYDILAMNGASAALQLSGVPVAARRRRGPHRQGRRQLRRQPRRGGSAREHRPRPDRRRHQRGHH